MPNINSAFDCRKVDFITFREALGEAAILATSQAGSEVIAMMNTVSTARSNDTPEEQAKVAYFVAYQSDDDDAVGLMVMFKEGSTWKIEDVFAGVSGSGLGSTLASFGMDYAIRDYGNTPNCEIRLTSLDEASCTFWKKMGFVMLPGVQSGHGGMVYRVSNSRPTTPLGSVEGR